MMRLNVALCAATLFLALANVVNAETIVALTSDNSLVTFDSATPGALLRSRAISGLPGGESIISIDRRPADGVLYAMSADGDLYALDDSTGAATLIGALDIPFSGMVLGMDFNPVVDRIRGVSSAAENFRVNVFTRAVTADTDLLFAAADPNFFHIPVAGDCAYTNNIIGANATTLYTLDTDVDVLTVQNPPNNGTLNTVGALGVSVDMHSGFDISATTGTAYAVLEVGGVSSLYTINTGTGAATLVGLVGPSPGLLLYGMTIGMGVSPTENEVLIGLNDANELLRFRGATPGQVISTTPVTGLTAGEDLVGIDLRPATAQLYGISDLDRVYTINLATGAATFVAATDRPVAGATFGFDINPVADRIRVVSDTGQNYRISPAGAVVIEDAGLAYAAGDINVAQVPHATASAYTNSFFGATLTTLYAIDSSLDILAIQNPPNNGTLTTVGPLRVATSDDTGFDISGLTGLAYAALSSGANGATSLYSVDLVTGAVALVGPVGNQAILRGLAVASVWTTADRNTNNVIELSELLRVIQFYNSGGLHCADRVTDTEDGFVAGPGPNDTCTPHATDYQLQNWEISLSELLRAIQFYNTGGYFACPGPPSEDGMCANGT